MQTWLLPTLSDVFNRREATEGEWHQSAGDERPTPSSGKPEGQRLETLSMKLKARREWCGAIAALEQLLFKTIAPQTGLKVPVPSSFTEPTGSGKFGFQMQTPGAAKTSSSVSREPHAPAALSKLNARQGLLLSGPSPLLSHPALVSQVQTGVFTPTAFQGQEPFQLPAAEPFPVEVVAPCAELPLSPQDPLATEQFCLVLTANFGILLVLGKDSAGLPAFRFSFEPETIQQAWAVLRTRLLITNHYQLHPLDALTHEFAPPTPDYRTVTEFSHCLLKHLPNCSSQEHKGRSDPPSTAQAETKVIPLAMQRSKGHDSQSGEVELLQALTHEIRTPLTTIRTLTRSLLKRGGKLAPNVTKRLETIDQECTEQINRMELIFRAAELATKSTKEQMQLTPISLEQLFQQSIPSWKKQAQRRGVLLDVVLPKKLPTIVSNPGMLNQVLTGLMEKFTRSLPNEGKIRVQVTTAGNQLKLQFSPQSSTEGRSGDAPVPQCGPTTLRALGQLLMFQPETGSLSLNLDVTKNLFHAMGGKLIVRRRPQQEVFTVFLPLVVSPSEVELAQSSRRNLEG
ncbi:MAG: sensor histidine kinase [Cyanophyceae cyanobacterium]